MSGIATLAAIVFVVVSASPVVAGDAPPAAFVALLIPSDVTHSPYLRLKGFVTNQSAYDLQDVRLHVDMLDTEGRRITGASGWAFGNALSGGRPYFIVALLAPGSTYRICVSSFDLLAHRRG